MLRRSGTSIGFGSVATGGIADNAVTDAKIRDSAALSVIGNATNASADPADIAAASDHQVLRRSGTAIGFGAVALDQAAAVTGALPFANGGTGQTTQQAAMNALAGAITSGQYLRGNGTNVVMSAIQAGDVPTFDTGTRMIFAQTTAPTGWTKDTSNYNNHALRVVTGSASTGGTVDFTTAFDSQTPSGTVTVTASTGQVAQGGTVSSPASTGAITQGGTVSVSASTGAVTQGGSVSVSASVGNTTLSTPVIPAHSHPFRYWSSSDNIGPAWFGVNGSANRANFNTTAPSPIGDTGGGGAHAHPISAPASFTGQPHSHPVSAPATFTGQPHSHPVTVTSTFSGSQHAHPVSAPATFSGSSINLAVKYLDVITATKN